MAKRKYGTMENIIGSRLDAARKRIEVCERYGMDPDPDDVELVASAPLDTKEQA